MIFKALVSPKQFCSYKGQVLKASESILHVNDKEVIDFLKNNASWECLEPIEEEKPVIIEPVEKVEVEPPKKQIKRGKK